MWRSPRPPSRLIIWLEDSLWQKDTKQNQQREKAHQAVRRDQGRLPKSSFSLTQDTLNSSSKSCDNTCRVSAPREAHRGSAPKVFMGAGHVGTLCWAHTTIPTPRRKQLFSTNARTHSVGPWRQSQHLGKVLCQQREPSPAKGQPCK